MLANPVYYVGATVYNKNSHGEFCWRTGGKFVIPPKKKGKATTGRKNDMADWVFPPTTTAIVTKELWDEVQTRLTSPKATIKRGLRDERLWLAGLLVCGKCGQKMTGNGQEGPNYRCTTYVKFGKVNPTDCKLHRVPQHRVEGLVNTYLEAIAPDIKELLGTKDNPALLNDVHKKLATRENELWNVFGKMRDYVRARDEEREVIRHTARSETPLEDILNEYRAEYDHDRERLEVELTAKESALTTLITNINRLPATAKNALAFQQKLIGDVDTEVAELRAKLVPLTDQLDAAYSDLEALDNDLKAAQEAAPGDDARRKALTLRRVVERVVLHFEHTERPAIDRRTKGKTVKGSVLAKAEFIPVTGQTFTVDTGPAPGSRRFALLAGDTQDSRAPVRCDARSRAPQVPAAPPSRSWASERVPCPLQPEPERHQFPPERTCSVGRARIPPGSTMNDPIRLSETSHDLGFTRHTSLRKARSGGAGILACQSELG